MNFPWLLFPKIRKFLQILVRDGHIKCQFHLLGLKNSFQFLVWNSKFSVFFKTVKFFTFTVGICQNFNSDKYRTSTVETNRAKGNNSQYLAYIALFSFTFLSEIVSWIVLPFPYFSTRSVD